MDKFSVDTPIGNSAFGSIHPQINKFVRSIQLSIRPRVDTTNNRDYEELQAALRWAALRGFTTIGSTTSIISEKRKFPQNALICSVPCPPPPHFQNDAFDADCVWSEHPCSVTVPANVSGGAAERGAAFRSRVGATLLSRSPPPFSLCCGTIRGLDFNPPPASPPV